MLDILQKHQNRIRRNLKNLIPGATLNPLTRGACSIGSRPAAGTAETNPPTFIRKAAPGKDAGPWPHPGARAIRLNIPQPIFLPKV